MRLPVEPPRVDATDELPETPGMVQVPGVAQLVDEEILHQARLDEQQRAVQADTAVAAATPPAGSLTADRNGGVPEVASETDLLEPGHERCLRPVLEPRAQPTPAPVSVGRPPELQAVLTNAGLLLQPLLPDEVFTVELQQTKANRLKFECKKGPVVFANGVIDLDVE